MFIATFIRANGLHLATTLYAESLSVTGCNLSKFQGLTAELLFSFFTGQFVPEYEYLYGRNIITAPLCSVHSRL